MNPARLLLLLPWPPSSVTALKCCHTDRRHKTPVQCAAAFPTAHLEVSCRAAVHSARIGDKVALLTRSLICGAWKQMSLWSTDDPNVLARESWQRTSDYCTLPLTIFHNSRARIARRDGNCCLSDVAPPLSLCPSCDLLQSLSGVADLSLVDLELKSKT